MPKKTAGRLDRPPNSKDFDKIPPKTLRRTLSGTSYRLHSVDPTTGSPRPPIHFTKKNNSRFDPSGGVGTLYVANTLAGALMEIFDDPWGAVGTLGRTLTRHEMKEWWVTRVNCQKSSYLMPRAQIYPNSALMHRLPPGSIQSPRVGVAANDTSSNYRWNILFVTT
jgi:hypothetical protein